MKIQNNVWLNVFIKTLADRYCDNLDIDLSQISYAQICLFSPREIMLIFSSDYSAFQKVYLTYNTDFNDLGVIVFKTYFEYLKTRNIKTLREAENARNDAIQQRIDDDYFESEYS